jgi:DNA-directed RNA polymerase specialized sigma24 family protein
LVYFVDTLSNSCYNDLKERLKGGLRGLIKDRNQYTSNLILDEEMTKKFNAEALLVARSLRPKYFSLFEFMTEEDIVMECWDKILRQDIGFDDSKKCKFSSFVRMMVNNRCIDMCRKIQKHEGVLSLNSTYSSDEGDTSTLSDYIPDTKSNNDFEEMEVESVINSLGDDLNDVPVDRIMFMLGEGYTAKEVCEELKISSTDVRAVKNNMFGIFKRRCSGSEETLADVLYGNEDALDDRKDEIIGTLSYVRDPSCGIKLSDVIKLVIKGYTYDKIGTTLGVSSTSVRSFLDKYSSMVI